MVETADKGGEEIMNKPYVEIEHKGIRVGMNGAPPFHVETPGYAVIICDSRGFNGINLPGQPGAKIIGWNRSEKHLRLAQALCDKLNEAAGATSGERIR
jgi:hypothetical protein